MNDSQKAMLLAESRTSARLAGELLAGWRAGFAVHAMARGTKVFVDLCTVGGKGETPGVKGEPRRSASSAQRAGEQDHEFNDGGVA